MASKNDRLKSEILTRFPKRWSIRRQSLPPKMVDGRQIRRTHVALVTENGNVWAHLTRNGYDQCLADLEFHTRQSSGSALGDLDLSRPGFGSSPS